MQESIQAGQICEVEDKDPSDVFIITGGSTGLSGDGSIEAVRLRDLQRNLTNPSAVTPVLIPRASLKVVAADLEAYIKSWNS